MSQNNQRDACAETRAVVNPGLERAEAELLLADERATLFLGETVGKMLAAGQVVLLTGDLGAGKTVFAKGLARGLGVGEEYNVSSPSFTLVNVYPGRLRFYHADLYRLDQGEALDLELLDEAADGVLAVEWAERLPEIWPPGSLLIELALAQGGARRARLAGPAALVNQAARVFRGAGI